MTDRYLRRAVLFIIVATLILTATGLDAAGVEEAPLPPVQEWNGASRALVVPADDPWITPFEAGGLTSTPRYDETVRWLRRLVKASPRLEMVSIGKSAEGRDIWMVIASRDRAFTPEKRSRSKRPLLLAHAGIHAGEIDGKDAGMMLLRDMTVGRRKGDLFHLADVLFIPILNVDGHERFSQFGRINQRGPAEMGWRTNANNLNLNRDYAKLDTEEVRALVHVINEWRPDLYLDLHVTDGIDYQYDATYGWNGPHAWSPAIAGWLDGRFRPEVDRALEAAGHVPGPLIFGVDDHDMTRGIFEWTASPRFSNGWGDLRHLPSVLLENHSLKPFDRRVLGTYVFLESAIRVLGNNFEELRKAVHEDQNRYSARVALGWTTPQTPPGLIDFKAIEGHSRLSGITGNAVIEYTGRPLTISVPRIVASQPSIEAGRPGAYWIPAGWREVIERLRLQEIEMEEIDRSREVEVGVYTLGEPKWDDEPFEGRVRVTAPATLARATVTFPAGSVRVPTSQPLGDLAVLLLEPASGDSFLQWGFFHSIFDRTEYVEAYVMEPMARRMLDADADLAREFESRLSNDEKFRASEEERLRFFYERTPFFDGRWRVYPVAREESGD